MELVVPIEQNILETQPFSRHTPETIFMRSSPSGSDTKHDMQRMPFALTAARQHLPTPKRVLLNRRCVLKSCGSTRISCAKPRGVELQQALIASIVGTRMPMLRPNWP